MGRAAIFFSDQPLQIPLINYIKQAHCDTSMLRGFSHPASLIAGLSPRSPFSLAAAKPDHAFLRCGPPLPFAPSEKNAISSAAAGLLLTSSTVLLAAVHPPSSLAAATATETLSGLLSREPSNALSLPTWTIHVSSVVEWVVAMALVWKYGDTPGNDAWKGLSWGMTPLLGGAMCACTWHFFYNAESLEVLVVLQAALTMIGNATMWLAAFRIYQSRSKA